MALPVTETRRVFFASLPDEGTRAALAASIAAPLEAAAGTLVEVPAENHHLTLAFVGSVRATQLGALCEIARSLRGACATVSLERLVVWRRAQVLALVAARRPPAPLLALRARLLAALHAADFPVDAEERFRPHVTIARKVTQAPVPARVVPVRWPIRAVALMASDTSGKTSRYTVLDTSPILDESAATAD